MSDSMKTHKNENPKFNLEKILRYEKKNTASLILDQKTKSLLTKSEENFG